MRHPTDGTLRRLLDEPAGVADAEREHIAGCPVCLAELAAVREDADLAGAALRHEVTPDVDEGWARLSRAVAADRHHPVAAATRGSRWRTALRSPVVAVVGVVALVTGASAAAAADWLPIFRTERVAPITVTQADLLRLPELSAYGTLEVTRKPDVRRVANAAAAREATGLSVPEVTELPRGVSGEPAVVAGDRMSATFRFSTATAARTAAGAGKTLPPPPAGLEGSEFRMTAGPGVARIWAQTRGMPNLVVARVVAPTAYSSGVPFGTAADYLLSLPGMPETVAKHLRNFTGDGTTLPLPVNSTYLTSRAADVGGTPATVLTSRDGVIAGVVWVNDGVVTAVAGSLSADEVLSVARNMEGR
jgi:hypothetical protein